MKIAIILGSVRENRKSDSVGYYLMEVLKEQFGITADLLDLLEYNFPVMKERFRNLNDPPPGMADFSRVLNDSQGIILITPEYNGSYSGALKNTLDYFKQEYVRKSLAAVTVSSGSWGGVNASHHLLSWALHVKSVPSPSKLMVQNVDTLFDELGRLMDPKFESRAVTFLKEFVWLTRALSQGD